MREYYEQLYVTNQTFYKVQILRSKFPKLTQKEIENLNTSITNNKIKLVIKILSGNKSPDSDDSTDEFH